MTTITKFSDNHKSGRVLGYKNLTPHFVKYGCYEVDVAELTSEMNESNQEFGQETQYCFQFSNYPQNDKYFVVGEITSKYEGSKVPFYLTGEVMRQARSQTDISDHKFFSCSVKWNKLKIKKGMPLFEELKRVGVCRSKAIWRKKIPDDSIVLNLISILL